MIPRKLTTESTQPRKPWYSTALAWVIGLVGVPSDAAGSIADGTIRLFISKVAVYTAATIFVVVGVILGVWTLSRANRYVTLVEAALSKTTENTPQSLKALESMILSYVDSGGSGGPSDYKKQVEDSNMSGALKTALTRLHGELSTVAAAPAAALSWSTGAATSRGPVVTEATEHSFLFLPAKLLQLPPGDVLKDGPEAGRLVHRELGIVPERIGTTASETESASPDRSGELETCVVNINTASSDQLIARLGLDAVMARRLIEYRLQRNGFATIPALQP